MNSRQSVPPHRFTVSEDELGLAEIEAILAVIDHSETKNKIKESTQYKEATKCVENWKTTVNDTVEGYKKDELNEDEFIYLVKQQCDELKKLIKRDMQDYYNQTSITNPPTDAFSDLENEAQSIANSALELANTIRRAPPSEKGVTGEPKGEEKQQTDQKEKDEKSKATNDNTDKQPETKAQTGNGNKDETRFLKMPKLYYYEDKLQEVMGALPRNDAKLDEWVTLGSTLPEKILRYPADSKTALWYQEVVENLFKYTKPDSKPHITHEQFAAMAYAALSQPHRPKSDSDVTSKGDASDAPLHIVNATAQFKVGSQQEENEDGKKKCLDDFRVPIWKNLLTYGRTIDSRYGSEHAQDISNAIVMTEILQQPSPVQLEHVTSTWRCFLNTNQFKHIPTNYADTMDLQAVTCYFQFEDFLDAEKKQHRSHEICTIIEQHCNEHFKDELKDESKRNNSIDQFWSSCQKFNKDAKAKMTEGEKNNVIGEMTKRQTPESHGEETVEVPQQTPESHGEETVENPQPETEESKQGSVTAEVVSHVRDPPATFENRMWEHKPEHAENSPGGNEQHVQDQIAIIKMGFDAEVMKSIVTTLDSQNSLQKMLEMATNSDKINKFRIQLYQQIQLYVMKQNHLEFEVTLLQDRAKPVYLTVKRDKSEIKITVTLGAQTHVVVPSSIKLSDVNTTSLTCTVKFTYSEPGAIYGSTFKSEPGYQTKLTKSLCALLLCINPEKNTSFLTTALSQVPRQYQINYL